MKQIFTRELQRDWPLNGPQYLKRGFDLDPSCKLWLPFYKYGSEQAKIYDQSGNSNHGTIAGAVPYPGNPQLTSVDSTYDRGDFTATNAFFWSSIDTSAYAGTDLGATPFCIIVIDSTGKKATGYLAGVGSGETLTDIIGGTNPALLNGDFSLGDTIWVKQGSTVIGGGVCTFSTGSDVIYQQTILTALIGQLIKTTGTSTRSSGSGGLQWPAANWLTSPIGATITLIANGQTGNWSKYGTTVNTERGFEIKNTGWYGTLDNIVLQRVTDPPATAVHIVSSLNGTTRAWESIESGFNPNTITSWRINA